MVWLSLVNIADMIIRLDIMILVPQSAAARITNVVCPMGKSSYGSGECMLSCLVRQRCKGKQIPESGQGNPIYGIREVVDMRVMSESNYGAVP